MSLPFSPRASRAGAIGASTLFVLLAGIPGCAPSSAGQAPAPAASLARETPPPPPPARWLPLIGEYGRDSAITIVLERDGRLWTHNASGEQPLTEQGNGAFTTASGATHRLVFQTGGDGRVASLDVDGVSLRRRQVGPESGNQLVITPVRPLDELRREALAASPPVEKGPFLKSDLVELTSLDPTIKLEIRYATTNNFLGTPLLRRGPRLHAAARGGGGRTRQRVRSSRWATAC